MVCDPIILLQPVHRIVNLACVVESYFNMGGVVKCSIVGLGLRPQPAYVPKARTKARLYKSYNLDPRS